MKSLFDIKKLVITMLAVFSISTLTFAPVAMAVDTQQQAKNGVVSAGGSGSGNESSDVTKIIKNVIGIVSFLVGLVAVLMIVIAGFRFVTSNGDSNTISSARNTIIYAVIGIVITIMAYAIVNFVLDNLTK